MTYINLAGAVIALNIVNWWHPVAITLLFAYFGRLVRGVTSSGAIAGAGVCFALTIGAGWGGFAALCVVFMLTWAATRVGRAHKQRLGTAEALGGRDALQVFANIGVSSVCALIYLRSGNANILVCAGAALAEAAADTASSEIGQALGGVPRLVTNWKAVAAGTNGAVSITGTLAGAAAAAAVSGTCASGGMFGWHGFLVCTSSAILGTFADSLMGATVERWGWIGNNIVNFLSTLIAAAGAWLLL